MRMIYFLITSSCLILLMLLVRTVFRRKLAPGMIYALWLIPLLRFMIPFGFVEVPLFGAMAELLNHPFAVTKEIEPETTESDYEKIEIFNEYVPFENPESESNGIKVYDPVLEMEPVVGELADTTDTVSAEYATAAQYNVKQIGIAVWTLGSMILGVYVTVLNYRLRKKTDKLEVIGWEAGREILLSHEVKTPCLVGVRNPKILITEGVLRDDKLYEYAIKHELAHFHQKDHLWNVIRIFMCVVYWWNPLVWYGAKCAAEDAELACDERVLKDKTIQERRAYGFALLGMMEQAQNSPLCMATSYFGGENIAKQRIESIARKTTTKKYVLIPVVLLLVVFNIAGCVYPSDKSYIKTSDWAQGETDEFLYDEANYEYSLQDEFQSMLFYYETYEYGEMTERSILSYGELDKKNNQMLLRDERHNHELKRNFVLEMNGVETSMPIPQWDITKAYAISHLYAENELLEVSPGDDLILMAIYQEKDYDITHTYSCEVIAGYDDQELSELFKDHNIVTLARLILSDLPAENLYEQMKVKEYPITGVGSTAGQIACEWATAFVEQNVESIKNLATENALQQMIDAAILDEEDSFGWSSPWPVFEDQHYRMIDCDNQGAEILYYAIDSTPHVYVWKETLKFIDVEDEIKVSSWSLERFDVISELDEYHKAYPKNQIAGTPMDYYINGLGETLNNNALLSSSETYRPLFEAGSAALELMNISKDYSVVHYNTIENEDAVDVNIQFLNKDGSTSSTSVTMWQPYGEDGIWIPKGETSLSIEEYNETYSEKEFSGEPEENKVCLAVMPDGISKAGGDYQYIIPEDQVKWIDHYKQACSLAVDGAWKDRERSVGVWLVFNDEWTCISDQGMIFDFDKRVEKEQIEEFYKLCMGEAQRYGTGTPIYPENFPEIISATLNYNGACTVTDVNVLKDLRKMIYTSKEIRGGSACPFTATLVLELKDKSYEVIYLATDSCSAWLTDGVYYEYFGYEGIEELSDIFETYGAKINADETILKIENNQVNNSLTGNTLNATQIIKQTEERVREGYKEAKLTYADNAEVGWNYYTENPWTSNAERDALAQAALKELYTLTGFNVEECTYTTDGRSRFIFGKSAENIKKSIAFYSRDYGFTLCGDSTPYIGFVNARRVHYSGVQQLDSPYHKTEYSGNGAIATWFLEHSGVYQGEKIVGFDAINLDDTVYTHIKLIFDGGYYVVVMDENIESVHEVTGPYRG